MRHDYKKETWETVEIKGTRCLFCDIRIDRSTIPEGMVMYEVADNDSDGMPCRMRPGILVNFFGTVISNHRFEPDEGDTIYLTDDDWKYIGEGSLYENKIAG